MNEVKKDSSYHSLVGNGRPSGLSDNDSFMMCQSYKKAYQQPQQFDISNIRYHYPNSDVRHNWDLSQLDVAADLENKYIFIEVCDTEIDDIRLASRNELTRGDAVMMLVHSKLKSLRDSRMTSDVRTNITDATYHRDGGFTCYFVEIEKFYD